MEAKAARERTDEEPVNRRLFPQLKSAPSGNAKGRRKEREKLVSRFYFNRICPHSLLLDQPLSEPPEGTICANGLQHFQASPTTRAICYMLNVGENLQPNVSHIHDIRYNRFEQLTSGDICHERDIVTVLSFSSKELHG